MTVRNSRTPLLELIQYITPDGITVNLHDPAGDRAVLLYEGDGLPSVSYSSTKGPSQHGSTILGVKEPEREIDLALRWTACSRDDYWTMRHELVDYLRPNRTDVDNPTPGVLRRVLSNGEIYDLNVVLVSGPKFIFPTKWDHFSIQEPLHFIAHNPILYNPTNITDDVEDFEVVGEEDIVYGFTFEFTFSDDDPYVARSFTVNYAGNWESFPTFTVEGPWSHLLIGNQETGKKIELDGYASPALEITTIDLTYNVKSIETDSNVSLLNYLTNDSTLGTFAIQPKPLVTDGINTIAVAIVGGTADTTVTMSYKNRYIGI